FDPTGKRYKLTQPLSDGRPVLLVSCLAMLPHVDSLVVVTGPRGRKLDRVLEPIASKIIRVECHNAYLGMGASMKAALRATNYADAWLVGLGDMPWVSPTTVGRVAAGLREGARMTRPFCSGVPGHPVGLAVHLREELEALPDGQGAVYVLRRHESQIYRIYTNDDGCIADIDYPEDLKS